MHNLHILFDFLLLVKMTIGLDMQILWEVTAGQMGRAPDVVTDTPGASSTKEEEVEEVSDDKELEEMKNRLQSLRS